MKTHLEKFSRVFIVVALLNIAAPAQTRSLNVSGSLPTATTLSLTFRDGTSDYVTYPSKEGDRYFIEVQTTNVPAFKMSDSSGAKLMFDNEKSNAERLVFWVAVQPGATPRTEFKNGSLILTFASGNPELPTKPIASTTSLIALQQAAAQQVTEDQVKSQPVELSDSDLAVPESPGFTVLGLTPQTVARPTTPRAFVSSLLNGVDQDGNFQSGIAFDTSPYLAFAGPGLTLSKYNSGYSTRLLARTQFSFATTKGASDDDKSLRLALGLRMTLWDAGDPHADKDLMKCFTDNLRLPPPPGQIDPDNPTVDVASRASFVAGNIKAAETCRAESRKRNWNRSSWIIAAAPSWISTNGQTNDFKWNGAGFWTSLAYGFEGIPTLEKNSQFIVHARYRNLEQVTDPVTQGKFITQDSFFLGGRWRFGNENSSANVEGVFQRVHPKGKVWDTSGRYSVGLERRVAENMWFALSFGTQQGRNDGKNNGFILSSFRWGFSQKRKYSIPGLNGDN